MSPRSLVLNQCTMVLPQGGQPMPCTQPFSVCSSDDQRRARRRCALTRPKTAMMRARQQEPERQEVPRVAAVRDGAHQELRDAVGDRQRRSAPCRAPPWCTRGARCEDVRDREREVVAHQVVGRVADEDAGEDLPAQPPVFRIDALGRQLRREWRRLRGSRSFRRCRRRHGDAFRHEQRAEGVRAVGDHPVDAHGQRVRHVLRDRSPSKESP